MSLSVLVDKEILLTTIFKNTKEKIKNSENLIITDETSAPMSIDKNNDSKPFNG
tara:strand:+ start:480 stop:641 length:162 start_codon:yes stop_codon:yes gene_type:complete